MVLKVDASKLNSMSRIRLGIVGAGHIAGSLASVSQQFKNAEVIAVASRDQNKADAFAKSHGIPKSYGSYEALMADPEIDAVYIATPNSIHKENAIAAAQSGKHILCEKPLATTVGDARAMFAAAEANGVHLIEGFLFRFQAQTQEVLHRLQNGDFGDVLTVFGGFGFTLTDPANPRWDPALGGGAMWDVGVYPLNLVRAIMGKPPTRVTASAMLTELKVDRTSTALLEYDDGRTATIWCSFEASPLRHAQIVGTKAAVEFTYSNNVDTDIASAYYVKRGKDLGEEFQHNITKPGTGFVLQVDAFTDLIEGRPFYGTTKQETLENTSTAEAIFKSFIEGKPVAPEF